jgi:carboxylesterase type B
VEVYTLNSSSVAYAHGYHKAFSQGGTVDTLYNVSYMIQNGVELNKPFIGVTLQYRLNAFGFVDGKEIKEAGVTNLGIRDQRLALQWVQENVAAFGGDVSKVSSCPWSDLYCMGRTES